MLVEEFNSALVDSLGNLLANLVRAAPVDHVIAGPSVFGLGTR